MSIYTVFVGLYLYWDRTENDKGWIKEDKYRHEIENKKIKKKPIGSWEERTQVENKTMFGKLLSVVHVTCTARKGEQA